MAWGSRVFASAAVTLLALALAACSSAPAPVPASAPVKPHLGVRAVYLESTSTPGLSALDLARHPQVRVVRTQEELESVFSTGMAIWVDIGAAGSADVAWLGRMTRNRVQPVALIGCNTWDSFCQTLPFVDLSGVPVRRSRVRPLPGFTVCTCVGLDRGPWYAHVSHDQTPTVSQVLASTDRMLRLRFNEEPGRFME